MLGLDAVYAATASALDPMGATETEYRALADRIASVQNREDLWSATDPLVLEFAQAIADDLALILDGIATGYDQLDGDVVLFTALCEDWLAPI